MHRKEKGFPNLRSDVAQGIAEPILGWGARPSRGAFDVLGPGGTSTPPWVARAYRSIKTWIMSDRQLECARTASTTTGSRNHLPGLRGDCRSDCQARVNRHFKPQEVCTDTNNLVSGVQGKIPNDPEHSRVQRRIESTGSGDTPVGEWRAINASEFGRAEKQIARCIRPLRCPNRIKHCIQRLLIGADDIRCGPPLRCCANEPTENQPP